MLSLCHADLVYVTKEGLFTRSGVEEVDEAEIFEGYDNTLVMAQTYTHEFQCKYKLWQYPFDSQVKTFKSLFMYIVPQECAIKMSVASQKAKTVQLLAQKVNIQDRIQCS